MSNAVGAGLASDGPSCKNYPGYLSALHVEEIQHPEVTLSAVTLGMHVSIRGHCDSVEGDCRIVLCRPAFFVHTWVKWW